MNVFDRVVRFMDHTEVSFVTLLAKIIPLLVPIIPAYVGYSHVTDQSTGLGFESWAGWVYGGVIEGLGYAAIYKAVQFWEHNRKYTAEKNQAPLFAAVAIYLVYLVVTLTVNVVLDYKAGLEFYKVIALGLISLLSVPAGLLMSISAVHTERTTERERTNERARVERNQRRNEQANEQRTDLRANEQRTNERPRKVRRTNEQVLQPTNEQRTNRSFGFSPNEQRTNDDSKQARLFDHIQQLQLNGMPVPGPSQLSRDLRMSKSYISERLNEWRTE
jgi:putative Mn2+ efflux pump MntP